MKHKPLNKSAYAVIAIAAKSAEEDTGRQAGQHAHRLGRKEVPLEQISWHDAIKDYNTLLIVPIPFLSGIACASCH